MKRAMAMCALGILVVAAASCGGNSTLNETEAVVFLTVDVPQYNPEVNVAQAADVTVDQMNIASQPKDPNGSLTATQDVNLTRWVITPYRTDGGTTASPQWVYDMGVYVQAGSSTSLNNARVYPAEYLRQPPLSYLLPENGGVDPETGQDHIRQSLKIEIYGTTVSGKSVKAEKTLAFNFTYGG